MKNNTFKAALLAIVASTALMTSTVYAGDDHEHKERSHHMKSERMGHHGDIRKMFRGLDLTDGQKAEIKALIKQQKTSSAGDRPSKEDRKEHKAEFFALISADNFDEAKAQEFINAKHQSRQAKGVAMLKVQNDIYQLLTPEQKAKFKEKFEKRRNMKGEGKAAH